MRSKKIVEQQAEEIAATSVEVPSEAKPKKARVPRAKKLVVAEPEPVVIDLAKPKGKLPSAQKTLAELVAEAPPTGPEDDLMPIFRPVRPVSIDAPEAVRSKRPSKVQQHEPPNLMPSLEASSEKPKRFRKPRTTEPITVSNREPFVLDADDSLVILEWRPKSENGSIQANRDENIDARDRSRKGRSKSSNKSREVAEASVQETKTQQPTAPSPVRQHEARPKRERKPRISSKSEESVRSAEVVVAAIERPKPERKPLIPTPENAPRVVLYQGVPSILRNQKIYPPVFFFGSSTDERRSQNVLDQIRLASESGIHLHTHLVEFEVDRTTVKDSVSLAAYMLSKTVEVDPLAQVMFRVVFVAPTGWAEKYPKGRYNAADGHISEPSVCDDDFWGVASDCLESFIKMLRQLELRDHILGVHLERGEWFFGAGMGYDRSLAAKEQFRDWARTRYAEDVVALQASWFDGKVTFENIVVPDYREQVTDSDKLISTSRRERRWVDYHLFLSDATVHRISELAYSAKRASEGNFLVGASYGYTFEWSHPGSGHLSLGKLLRTHEIDFIAGPPSYKDREPGGSAAFPGPIDSFALNGKLYLSEEDFKTSIGTYSEPDDFNPVIKTPQALENIHWRGAGAALSHASGVCWMDLWGNGWLKTQSIWDRASQIERLLTGRLTTSFADPDVAIFIDERSLAYLVDEQAFSLLVQNARDAVLRSGLSAGFYLLSDLTHREKFPESKLYIFLNAWDIRADLRSMIKSRLQRDKKVLFWLYAAGLFDGGRESLERVREVTGIALKPQPFHCKSGTTIFHRRHPLCEAMPERGLIGGTNLEPSYFAIPEDATVLGEYTQTGLPSFVVKDFRHEDPAQDWTSVFLGEPYVTPALIRALGHMAGAHVWNYQEDIVHARAPFITVHCPKAGMRTMTLPDKWSAYNFLESRWEQTDTRNVRFMASDGSTHLFLVGIKEEIEAVLNADPTQLLKMTELPPEADNTVRFDLMDLDIPIMRLDEWMESGPDSESSDDLFLLHSAIDFQEPEPEPEEFEGRRRKRRGRRGQDRPDFPVPSMVTGGEAEVNFVFRKRE